MPFLLQERDEVSSPKVFAGGKFLKGLACVLPHFPAVAQIKRNGPKEAAEGDHACSQNPLNCFSTTSIGGGKTPKKKELKKTTVALSDLGVFLPAPEATVRSSSDI